MFFEYIEEYKEQKHHVSKRRQQGAEFFKAKAAKAAKRHTRRRPAELSKAP